MVSPNSCVFGILQNSIKGLYFYSFIPLLFRLLTDIIVIVFVYCPSGKCKRMMKSRRASEGKTTQFETKMKYTNFFKIYSKYLNQHFIFRLCHRIREKGCWWHNKFSLLGPQKPHHKLKNLFARKHSVEKNM